MFECLNMPECSFTLVPPSLILFFIILISLFFSLFIIKNQKIKPYWKISSFFMPILVCFIFFAIAFIFNFDFGLKNYDSETASISFGLIFIIVGPIAFIIYSAILGLYWLKNKK